MLMYTWEKTVDKGNKWKNGDEVEKIFINNCFRRAIN